MKKLVGVYVMCVMCAACSSDKPAQSEATPEAMVEAPQENKAEAGIYTDAFGTVKKITDDIWIIEPEGGSMMRLCLEGELVTEAIRVEGLRVRFSGEAGQNAPNVRAACDPFALTAVAPAQ